MTKRTTTSELLIIVKGELEDIAGNWNGDESGLQEEESQTASDAIEKIDELIPLLKELGY